MSNYTVISKENTNGVSKEENDIVIEVNGGVIVGVLVSDKKPVNVTIVDYDIIEEEEGGDMCDVYMDNLRGLTKKGELIRIL